MRRAIGGAAVAGTIAAVAVLGSASPARADVGDDLRGYYGGERVAALVIGGTGAAAAATGGYLLTRDGDLARGLGGSWIALGGLEALVAAFYLVQVGAETHHYEDVLARDPAGYRAQEMDHLQGTSSRFVYYRAIELGLTLAGATMAGYGLAARRDAWTGTGVGIFSLALPLFVIDSFNDARAHRYLDEVRRFQPTVGLGPSGSSGGWQLVLSGRL